MARELVAARNTLLTHLLRVPMLGKHDQTLTEIQEFQRSTSLCQSGVSCMKVWWAARLVVLACFVFHPGSAQAQSVPKSRVDAVTGSTLGQNYPNPVTTETTIPFAIGGAPSCVDPSRRYRVTLRVYNVLTQQVATPVLQSGSTGAGGGEPLRDVVLTCGQYTAFWDGKNASSGRDAASGIYLYRLEVDGRAMIGKMTVIR